MGFHLYKFQSGQIKYDIIQSVHTIQLPNKQLAIIVAWKFKKCYNKGYTDEAI